MQKKKESVDNKKGNETAEPHQIGDKSFKTIMKVRNTALEYIQVFFPKLYDLVDTSNFELDNTNYIKEDFDQFYSDVVYRTYL